MIELKKSGKDQYDLWIDGVKVKKNEYKITAPYRLANKKKNLSLNIYTEDISRTVASHRFSDLPPDLYDLRLKPISPVFNSNDADLSFDITKEMKLTDQFSLNLNSTIKTDSWKHLWSSAEYKEELGRILESNPTLDVKLINFDLIIPFVTAIRLQLPNIMDTSLVIEAAVGKYSNTLNQLHELVESSLQSKISHLGVERIIRSIEFPPEYHRSGVTILSYFADVLRHKNLSENVKVSIEQSGLKVSLVIDSPTGQRELIEQTLEAYGMVVLRKQPPEFLTTDPYEVAELKSQLRIAEVQIETQRELLAAKNADVESLRAEVHDTRDLVRRVQEQAGEDRTRFMALMEGLVSHNTALATGLKELAQQAALAQNAALAGALDNLNKLIERGVREDDREEVIQNLTTIQHEDPGVFRRVYDMLAVGAVTGVAGNYVYAWLQFFVGTLPK